MAAYYQPHNVGRQRLPPIDSVVSADETSSRNPPPHDDQQSFLIFPAPPGPTTGSPNANANTSNEKALISPTNSSVSLQTSLLASVAARSSRPPNSTRSNSREGASTFSEWEELKNGPLPLPRGRRRASSAFAVVRPRHPTLHDKTELERTGSGWAWTLDADDLGVGGPELSGWGWTIASSSSGSNVGLEIETRYDDASSQFHATGSGLEEEGNGINSLESTSLEIYPSYPTHHWQGSPQYAIRQLPLRGRTRPQDQVAPRRLSLKLQEPPSYTSRNRKQSKVPNPPSSIFPFGTFIQALLSIDDSTMKLLDQHPSSPTYNSHRGQQASSLFGLADDLTDVDEANVSGRSRAERETLQKLKLLQGDADSSPHISTIALRKGLDSSSQNPANPFSFPVYLLSLSWDYGLRRILTLSGRAEQDS